MTSRTAIHRFAGSTIAAFVLLVLTGCASRSLNAPPVVDWSDGAVPAKPPTSAPPSVASPTAVPQPIGNETVEQRPLGPSTVPGPQSNAPLKNGPPGVKRPYSDATLAEMSRPDGDGPAVPATVTPPAEQVPPAAPVAATSPATIAWQWPAKGKSAAGFVAGKSNGVDIAGNAGDPVFAAADGKVTFAGSGVRGYGNFVIVSHSRELLSVYANNQANLVKEGAMVTKGQKIAEMGRTGSDPAKLHFEIRNDSKPVDPLTYLPSR